MPDRERVKYDIERCISHVPDACRDCYHYTGTVGFDDTGEGIRQGLTRNEATSSEKKAKRAFLFI